jgi:hypothetical protein
MPAAEGASALVICTGHGLGHFPSLAEHRHPLPKRGEQLCAFASAAHLAPPALHAATLFSVVAQRSIPPELNGETIPTAASYRQQSPRAPPALA